MASAQDAHEPAIAQLGVWHLVACAALLVVVVAASASLELGLESRLVVSALRCATQLMVLCAFVLEPLFQKNSPALICGYLCLIIALASREASARLTYAYEGVYAHFFLAFAVGAGCVIAYAASLVLALEPFYDAKYLIPVSGMVVGNVLTSTALGANAFLTDLAEGSDRVELRLARGASWREAALPALRRAMTGALTPTLNSMAVMGLVMMPGMMTGQMLGGQPPLVAGGYQVMIMYLVTAAGCVTTGLLLFCVSNAVFDQADHRLLRGRIAKRTKAQRKDILIAGACAVRDACSAAWASATASPSPPVAPGDYGLVAAAESKAPSTFAMDSDASNVPSSTAPLVVAEELVAARTGIECSLELRAGDRTSITGETGAGKSQLLKTIAKLVAPGGGSLSSPLLPGERGGATAWRAKFAYVPQDRPTLSGSPRDLLATCRSYAAHRGRGGVLADADARLDFLAAAWGLDVAKLDESWYTLSGGEAQRANLAIALALRPDALLLDEPTSACDAVTTALVEATLRAFKGALLLVTHDQDQAARLCQVHLRLVRTSSASSASLASLV